MRKTAFLVVAAAACSGLRLPKTAEGAPVLAVGGAVKDGPFAFGPADLAKLPRRTVRGLDPGSGREAAWEGASIADLVDRLELEKGADVVVIRTADRAAIPIPLGIVYQFRPVIADRADGHASSPRIVAWPTAEQRGIETDPRAVQWWAHAPVGLDLADWQKTFGAALATPDGAPEAARRGSALYGERCITCHRMRGAGGERGPDLTSVATRLRAGALVALLPGHPGWKGAAGDPTVEEGAAELWSFLHAVAEAGTPPAAVPAPAEERSRPAPVRR